ncbi:LOW QUALITY PROTEIN: sperm microtubule inner protein 11 [Gastrophryne carolinensis]
MVTADAFSSGMAFFGLTHLGYQAPLRAARVQGEPGEAAEDNGSKSTKLPALVPQNPYVSHRRYQEIVRRHQELKVPKESQRMPLTTGQNYGWWLPQDSRAAPESAYPWIETARYPMINSPMTRFVDQMSVTNKEFRLF